MIQLSDQVGNIVGKGEITCYFSFFHNVFKSCLLLMCQIESIKQGVNEVEEFIHMQKI